MENGKCIIFSAPSGAGKTTIVQHLLKKIPNLEFSISATSRPPRGEEKHGVDYYFLSAEDFKKKISEGEFLEWEQVYENRFYGTLREEIDRIWNSGKQVIFDVDVIGGINLKSYFGDKALSIFVEPPSLSHLEKRLRNRSTEDEKSLRLRLEKAEEELSYSNQFDKILTNDDLNTALETAEEWVRVFIER